MGDESRRTEETPSHDARVHEDVNEVECALGEMRSYASLWLAKPWYLCPGPNAGKQNL